MTLKETITNDMRAAFKAGDQVTRGALTMLLSVIQNREIAKRTKTGSSDLTEEETIEALTSEMKKRRESAATYTQGGRPELAEKEEAEAAVLARYLPEQLTEDVVKALVAEAITATGASGPKDIGKVMGAVTPKTKGRFDGARVSELVKSALAS